MRVGVYSRDVVPGAAAFCGGLTAAGHEGLLRSAPDWNDGCYEREFDAVALFGLQGKGERIRDAYAGRVPVIVIDYGYLRRTNSVHDWKTGHWSVSLGALNVLPAFPCPSDRFEALGVKIRASGGDPSGYTLICVQTAGDMSHGMDRAGLQAWCDEQAAKYPGAVIRPHPQEPDHDYGLPRCKAQSLDDALAGARLVVTANSNVGHDALLAGVPVVGTLPAPWADLAGPTPSLAARQAYFNRVAYGQWTWEEFATGAPQRFLIDHVMVGNPLPIDERPAEPKRRGRPPKAKD